MLLQLIKDVFYTIGVKFHLNKKRPRAIISISPTKLRNWFIGDPILDWFNLHGEEKGFQKDEASYINHILQRGISFEQLKPSVRLLSQGVILPNASSTPLYFEAVNLSAVDVRIIKIFEDNVLQYLQTSNLNTTDWYDLNRVGRRIAKKTITLKDVQLGEDGIWKSYGINLAEYFNADPGAIYRVELSFKKDYALYNCDAIYLMAGFQFSKGACWERALAKHWGLIRYYEIPRHDHELEKHRENLLSNEENQ